MFSNRTRQRLVSGLSLVVCFALLLGPVPAHARFDPASSEPQDTLQAPSPGRAAPFGRRPACDLYPIALHTSSLAGVPVGDVVADILNGSGPGNFGWLTWTGDTGVPALVASLTPPGNAGTYINPMNPADHLVSVGDWGRGRPGVANASSVRAALDRLKTIDISVPVWDAVQGSGSNTRYRVTNFALIRITDYRLPGQNRISARFLGYNPACGDNLPPLAVADAYTTNEGTLLSVPAPGILENDSDPNDDPLTAILEAEPTYGTFTLNSDGSFIYTPVTGYSGSDTFTYKANDGDLDSNVAIVSITVVSSNSPPVAVDDSYEIDGCGVLSVMQPGVLANDTDVDSDALTAALVSAPLSGTLALNPDGSFVYTPTIGFHGTYTFTYTASDGVSTSSPAAATISVTPPPEGQIVFQSNRDGNWEIYSLAVDVVGHSVQVVGGPYRLTNNPALDEYPSLSQDGRHVAFSSRRDGNDELYILDLENVSGVIRPASPERRLTNDPAQDWRPAWSPDGNWLVFAFGGIARGVTAIRSDDTDGSSRTRLTSAPGGHDWMTWSPDGKSIAYIYNGYTPYNSIIKSFPVTVTNSTVTAGPERTVSSGPYDDSADWSPNGDRIVFYSWRDTGNLNQREIYLVNTDGTNEHRLTTSTIDEGAPAWSPDGSKIVYATSRNGNMDLFVMDMADTSGANVVRITTNSAEDLLNRGAWACRPPELSNEAPVAADDTFSTQADQTLTVPAPGILGNDTDPDADALRAMLVSDVSHGTLALNPDGSFVYTPATSFSGDDSFTYKANDGSLDSNVATVTITVSPPVCNVGPWISVPDLDTARYSHQTVLLVNGKVLVAGGTQAAAAAGDDFASTEIYDPATNTWAAGPSMNAARTGFSATVLQDGRVLMAGGEHFGVGQTSAEIYNPSTNTWSLATSMSVPRHGHTATLLQNGKVLVVGGSRRAGNDPAEATAEIYDPQTNEWTAVTSMATARQGHTATLLNDGRVLVTGGNSVPWSWTSASKVELYDPGSNTWSSAPDMSISRAAHTATLLNDGRVLVAGGEGDGPSTRASAEVYDAATNTWSPIPDMAVSRSRHTATLLPTGKVLVAGGWSVSQSTILASAEVYDPTNNTWTTASDLEQARNSHTATLLCNGRTLFVGGAIRTGTWVAIANAELYDPQLAPAAPVAVDDAYETAQDQTLTIPEPGVLANDSDPDGDPLTAVYVDGPIHGVVTLNPDGSFTYSPSPGYSGADQFTYRANDGVLDSNIATVFITVQPSPNRPPEAVEDSYSALYETSLTIAAPGVLDNDSDPDGDPITAALVGDVSHGTLTLAAGGGFTYTPAGGFSGEDSFTYRASDGSLTSDVATVTISVGAPPNRPPVAVDDSYSTQYETSLTIAAPGVLANDSDPDDDPLAANLVSNVAHGTLTLNADGSFEYAPAAGYSGADQFTYRANDGVLDSTIATVTITVGEPDNSPPVANDDTGSVDEDEVLTVAAPGVLGNDSDPDSDPLTAVLVSNPAHGALALNADGSYVYTPAPDFNGADSFTSKANDGELDSNVATVTLAVAPVNDAPVAADYELDVPEDNTLVVSAPGVLNLVYDVDGDPLTARVGSPPAHGVLDLQPTGDFEYTPAANFHGTDSFTFIASDGQLDSNPGTITITVTPLPDAPVAANDAYSVDGGATLTIAAPGVLANDSDPDGDALTAVLAASPVHGALTLNANGSFTYTPASGFSGADGFTYRANDGSLSSNVASVSIIVGGPPNRPPVAVDDAYGAASDQTLTVDAPGVLANDSDPDGNSLTAILVSDVTHGALALNANGSFSYTPQAGYTGPDSFTYKANDGQLDSDPANVAITVAIPPGETPTAQITNPVEGTRVTAATNIVGTASSTALASYRLEHRLADEAGSGAWITFASGNTPVTNGTLGVLDPTLLINGIYDIRLTAIDVVGQFASASTTVVVEGQQKIGIFTLSFTDVEVPLAGIPIQVTRTYDSRDKVKHDFGVGWTLDISTARVQENKVLGQNWQGTVSGGLFPNYCIVPTRPNVVTITLPDGSVFRFEPVLSPANGCQQLVPLSEVTISYRPLAGTNASLAPVGSSTFQVVGSFPGDIELWDLGGAAFADFDRYQFTLYDGRRLTIDQQAGLESIRDLNNNTLTITPGGISHSSGQGVTFTRDAQGRITQITDPAGKIIAYAYDGSGDLVSVTDQGGNVTQFTYGANHYLQDILDPRGVQAIRSEYDEDGRLIRTIDADGNDITYEHQLAANTELVTNRLGDRTAYQYDSRGNVTQQTDAVGNVTLFTYDGNDNQLSETDPLGRTTTYTYDANDNLLTSTDALGHVTRYTYNSQGQVLTNTDALGRVTINTYDANDNLLTTRDPLGKTTSYTYDARGNRTSMTDALGYTTTYEYDTLGRMTQEVDALGHATTYTCDANGNRLSETQTRTTGGGVETMVTTYQYDDLNRLVRTTYPDGSATETEYHAIGQQSATIDQLGRRTTYEYDLSGRLVRTVYPDNSDEQSTYDAEGRTETSVDRMGRTTAFTYDALGRLERTTYPGGAFTTTTYDDAGQTVATTDERGNSTTYGYDDAGRRTSVTDALGHVTSFGYDANGNQLTMTDANGHTVTYEYDANNRRTRTLFADGTSQITTYDDLGRRVAETDQTGKTTQFGYDALGRLTSVTDTLGQVTSYTYDEVGNQLTQTDANDHTTRFAYDSMGRRTRRALPMAMAETYAYDDAGNLAAKTDFNGKTTTYAYDAMNRLLSKTPDPSFGQPAVTFSYLASGQRQSMTDASGVTTYTYDNRDRLLSKATPFGTLTYTYDDAGNLTSIRSSNADGVSVDYTYDALNRLATATDNTLASGVTSYSYDDVGNLASYLYPNGVEHSYSYDSLNRLTTLAVHNGPAMLASYAYTLGPAGNRLSVVEWSGRTVAYAYDDLYRLTGETIAADPNGIDGTIGYTYDPVGNRLARTSTVVPVPPATYGYDANDRLLSDSYDANGNTVASDGHSYAYDFENRLVSYDNRAVTIVYDGDGNRVAKTAGGVTTNYLVDDRNLTGYAQVFEEIVSGVVQRRFTYALDLTSQYYLLAGSWTVSYYGYDGQESVRLLTDESATVIDQYDFDAFGSAIRVSGSSTNNYLYTGDQYDPDLGFYNLRARYLNAQLGRFLTADAYPGHVYDPHTLHQYAYSKDDPVNWHDPSGKFFVTFVGLVNVGFDVLLTTSRVKLAFKTVKKGLPPMAGSLFIRAGTKMRYEAIDALTVSNITQAEIDQLVDIYDLGGLVAGLGYPVSKLTEQSLTAVDTLSGWAKAFNVTIPTKQPQFRDYVSVLRLFWIELHGLFIKNNNSLGRIIEKTVLDNEHLDNMRSIMKDISTILDDHAP